MKLKHLGITIDLNRDHLLSDQAKKLMTDYYMLKTETSPQHAFARAATAYCRGDLELAQRIYDYSSQQWFMYSSPILSNAPLPQQRVKGLPISCFLSYVPDTIDGLTGHNEELARLSVAGGGVGGHWSQVRGISDKSVGVIPHMKVSDAHMLAYKQGKTRKGSYAAYLDIDHPDIIEFINFKLPTGGDIARKCFNIFNAVNVTNKFMRAVKAGEQWSLIDPNTKRVTDTVPARDLWQRILEARFRTGSPYVNFIDTANKFLPPAQKEKGLRIHGSNLCNEIHLPTSDTRTAVCCLSSVNLEKYDDWKDTTMVQDLIVFLDNVLQFFIENAPSELEKAKYSASRERSLGLGAMGFHGLLQSKGIPWESALAVSLNTKIFKRIKDDALKASKVMAYERGFCPDGLTHKLRNMHLLAIAPNANSSILCGCSASIEPIKSNCYVHRTRAGAHTVRNKYLTEVLKKHNKDNDETWNSIVKADGSVQHLEFLDEYEKDTFKTAFEIDQHWVVEQAAARQQYICQGQSVNLFFGSGSSRAYVNSVHLKAFNSGLKGLYYLRTTAGKTGDKVGEVVQRVALQDADECLSCHG